MDIVILILAVLVALVIGGTSGLYLRKTFIGKGIQTALQEKANVLEAAEEEKKRLLLQAKEESFKIRSSAEAELKERRAEVNRLESRVSNREEGLERRGENLEQRERSLTAREKEAEATRAELDEAKERELQRLEAISELSRSDVREILLKRVEDEAQHDLTRRYRDIEQRFKDEADEKARQVVTLAIQRLAADVVSENTTNVVPLPSDDMKGRLIGREGRNIRAIEAATGVDLIVDDTPEAVTISCFDPVRREIARIALSNLVRDGRIHPTRIEETVEKARQEVDETMRREGERGVLEAGVLGLHPDLIKLIGRLKFRYSYGENILDHSIEVARLSGMLAAEIGAKADVARAGGLLHDIGKALTHEVEGSHIEIGGEIAEKYNLPEDVYRAIVEHHDDDRGSVEAFLVAAADAMSAARPGARRDTYEQYVKRLEALETVGNSFQGVQKCFAIQAGREVRIMVQPDSIDDMAATKLARDIVKKIEEDLVYPGYIKVTVVRETRSIEYAR
jgi:ribonuclease Y